MGTGREEERPPAGSHGVRSHMAAFNQAFGLGHVTPTRLSCVAYRSAKLFILSTKAVL